MEAILEGIAIIAVGQAQILMEEVSYLLASFQVADIHKAEAVIQSTQDYEGIKSMVAFSNPFKASRTHLVASDNLAFGILNYKGTAVTGP